MLVGDDEGYALVGRLGAVAREWGRIGAPGTVRSQTFEREEEARRAEQRGIRRWQLHGYQPMLDVVARWAEVMAAGGSIHPPRDGTKIKSKSRRYSRSAEQGNLDF
jgi:predicted DNA-binding WGR domain protein